MAKKVGVNVSQCEGAVCSLLSEPHELHEEKNEQAPEQQSPSASSSLVAGGRGRRGRKEATG